jgi:hypothetical protein
MDTDGNRLLDKQEFYWGLKNLGCTISKKEAGLLLEYLDTSKDGYVNYNEFLIGVRGSPNATRQEVIDRAFNKFDIFGENAVYAKELQQVFTCPKHPKVLSGDVTSHDVFVEFLATFGEKGGNGRISRDHWNDHYAAVSAQIENDSHFVSLMVTTWRL